MATADTKSQILDTAERLFAQKGFDAVSLRNIVTVAKVNLAAVHYHFGSKQSLLHTVVARRLRPINEERLAGLAEAQAKAGKPFFVQVSHYAVHLDIFYREKSLKKARAGKIGRKHTMPEFAAMTSDVDEGIGMVLDRIQSLGLQNSTYIFFLSDNGGRTGIPKAPQAQEPRNAPLRDGKHSFYEGGIRVPTIVRWPEKITAGTSNATPLISNDFYPTLLELAGCPTEPQQHVDGISFKKVLLGKSQTVERSAIYWHYPHSRQEAAIRAGQYKLLHRFKQGRVELYDLKSDLGERTDLSQQKPEVAKQLLAKLKSWQKNVGAKFQGDAKEQK